MTPATPPASPLSTPDLLWQRGLALMEEARSFSSRSQWTPALAKLDEAMTLAPALPGLQMARAQSLAQLHHQRESVQAALAELMERRENLEALSLICSQLALTEEEIHSSPKATLRLLDQIVQVAPEAVGGLHLARAACLKSLSKTAEALSAVEQELAVNPCNEAARVFRSQLQAEAPRLQSDAMSLPPAAPASANSPEGLNVGSTGLSGGTGSSEQKSIPARRAVPTVPSNVPASDLNSPLEEIRQRVSQRKQREHPIREKQLEELRNRMASDPYCQKFTLDDTGRPLPVPREQTEVKLRTMNTVYPADLGGKTVLDIGTNLGYFAFESFFRGAIRIVGLEQDLERTKLIQDVNRFFRFGIEFHPDRFSMQMADTYGEFDLTFVCSCYHYFYLEYRDHDRIMQELARATRGRLIFEGPLDLQDVSWRKHVAGCTAVPLAVAEQEFTPERILGAARRHFRQVTFVGSAQYLPHRQIWVFDK